MATTKRDEQRKRRQTNPNLRANGYEYVRCKALPHAWDPVGPIADRRKTRRTFGALQTFRCEHCGSLRFDVVSRLTGDLLYRWYEHQDGYSTERHPKSYWRVAYMDEMDSGLLEQLEDGW